MKKNTTFILLLMELLVSVASCSPSSDGTATCTYYVATDNIAYADSLEGMRYDSLVKACIVSLKLTSYSFTEDAISDNGLSSFAVEACDAKAVSTFLKKKADAPTLNTVRDELFSKNQQFFTERNIASADEIDLHSFSVYLTLWNFTHEYAIQTTTIEIR